MLGLGLSFVLNKHVSMIKYYQYDILNNRLSIAHFRVEHTTIKYKGYTDKCNINLDSL